MYIGMERRTTGSTKQARSGTASESVRLAEQSDASKDAFLLPPPSPPRVFHIRSFFILLPVDASEKGRSGRTSPRPSGPNWVIRGFRTNVIIRGSSQRHSPQTPTTSIHAGGAIVQVSSSWMDVANKNMSLLLPPSPEAKCWCRPSSQDDDLNPATNSVSACTIRLLGPVNSFLHSPMGRVYSMKDKLLRERREKKYAHTVGECRTISNLVSAPCWFSRLSHEHLEYEGERV
ncbi:uncharacterized protein ARMOST_22168 [Armillaria ostoyae]|uniref:Uncharacterized protein n=1 Tax=Armillaria ostoyae TaxID=47428 RepID=A0A284SC39_ARMOS|nr:uncharacterized protein ARMOST_22168 [Armillaria ostoyae]